MTLLAVYDFTSREKMMPFMVLLAFASRFARTTRMGIKRTRRVVRRTLRG